MACLNAARSVAMLRPTDEDADGRLRARGFIGATKQSCQAIEIRDRPLHEFIE